MQKTKIVILGTGGTIAGRSADPSDHLAYVAAEVGVGDLIAAIPALDSAYELLLEQVAQIDSKDISFRVLALLVDRVHYFLGQDDVAGIVITHGTDTLEETAYFLLAVLGPTKPVVLTCAMRPASALTPDGPQNLYDAVALASRPDSGGVLVVCAGAVHGAAEVQKHHLYRLDAFTSGDAGPVAYMEGNRLRLLRNWPVAPISPARDANRKIAILRSTDDWPRVEIVMNYAGANGDTVRMLAAAGVAGLVLAGTGNGTAHCELEAALRVVQASGIRVMRTSRCADGRMLPVAGDPLEDACGLSPVKARIALMLALMFERPPSETAPQMLDP